MDSTLYRSTLFALYQISLIMAIVMLPLAVMTKQMGFTLPAHKPVDRFGSAYEQAAENTA